MYKINQEDKSIYVTRGDAVLFDVEASFDGNPYTFMPGDLVRIKVFKKKNCAEVVLEKDFPVTKATDEVQIYLSEDDTKIGNVISKPVDYWYEVELNPLSEPQTIIGYDEDGARIFKLFPEGADKEVEEYIPEDEEILARFMDDELDLSSKHPVENQVIARAIMRLEVAVQEGRKETATVIASAFKTDNKTWDEAINDAINSVEKGKVLLPSGVIECHAPIKLKSNICLEGMGIEATTLRCYGCHGITIDDKQYLRFAEVKNLTLRGDNGGENNTYDNTKNGINLVSKYESYQCCVENVRIHEFAGKGLYASYDFNNLYRRVFVSKCGGNGIEICGLNTCTLENCYVDYVPAGYCAYRVYGEAVMISCNGMSGDGDYWGVFGREGGKHEDADNGERQHNVALINCNIEDFGKSGCKFLYSGGFSFENCTFYAKPSGEYEYYITTGDIIRPSLIINTSFISKGSTTKKPAKIRCATATSKVVSFVDRFDTFTVDESTVCKFATLEFGAYEYLQQALVLGHVNIKGMSYFHLGGNKHTTSETEPKTGEHKVGEIVYAKNPFAGGYIGWVCVEAGTPGTWKRFGAILA